MKVRKRTAKDYRVSRWGGGKTREFLLSLDGASHAGQDFPWRVSLATAEFAESDFTSLPDYRHFLTPLSGALRLSQNGGALRALGALEVLEFDSRVETKSRGEATDFNLMLRKGEATDGMITAVLGMGESCRFANLFPVEAAESDALLLYCYTGAAAPRRAEKEWVAEVGAYLLLSSGEGETAGPPLTDTEPLAAAEHTILAFAWMRQH